MNVTRHATKKFIKNDQMDLSIKGISGDISAHWHEFYELELILQGQGTYMMDDVAYEIQPGSLCFMSPISFHKIHFEGEAKLINAMFPINFANANFLSRIFKEQSHFYTQLNEREIGFFRTLAEDAVNYGENGKAREYLEAVLNCMLAKISVISSKEQHGSRISPIGRSILYIQDNLTTDLSLESVSAVANYSPNYFSERFKKETGQTFNSYVTELRLSFAKKLLRYSDLTVTEICYECGFRDYANFMRSFKNHFGTSPKKFREEYLNTLK